MFNGQGYYPHSHSSQYEFSQPTFSYPPQPAFQEQQHRQAHYPQMSQADFGMGFQGLGSAHYPPQFGPQQPDYFANPMNDKPQVNMEVNIILNEENIIDMAQKIPFIQTLLDKGILRTHVRTTSQQPPRPAPILPEQLSVSVHENRQEEDLSDDLFQYKQLKADIEKILDEEMNETPNKNGSYVLPQFLPQNIPKKLIVMNSEQSEVNCEGSGDVPIKQTLEFEVYIPVEPKPQFSFQKLDSISTSKNGGNLRTDFKNFIKQRRISTNEQIEIEFEKICQNQSRKIRAFWRSRETVYPYTFKRRLIEKNNGIPENEIIEIVDYSYKTILDGHDGEGHRLVESEYNESGTT